MAPPADAPPSRPRARTLRSLLLRNAFGTVAYLLLAVLSLGVPMRTDPALWLPAGLGIALAFRWGLPVLPGLVLGSVLVEIWVHPGPLLGPVLAGLLVGLQPLGVALLALRWQPRRQPFQSVLTLMLFLLVCWLGGVISTLLADLLLPKLSFFPSKLSRLCGLLALAPVLLSQMQAPPGEGLRDFRRWDWWLALGALICAGSLAPVWLPGLQSTPMALILPVILVATLRFQPPGTTVLLLVVALIKLGLPALGWVTPAVLAGGAAQMTIQQLLGNFLTLGLFVMVAIQERARLVSRLEAQSRHLEQMVVERTHELMVANARLERLSQRDPLTGIANRRRFEQALRTEWIRARDQGRPVAVAFFDVDFFKAYNDRYGHPAGDRVLRQVARTLASVFLPEHRQLIARYGGEEFVVLLPGLTTEAAARLAETFRLAIRRLGIEHRAGGGEGVLTVSGGVASRVPPPGEGPALLVEIADSMLYAAKQAGRDQLGLQELEPSVSAPFETMDSTP